MCMAFNFIHELSYFILFVPDIPAVIELDVLLPRLSSCFCPIVFFQSSMQKSSQVDKKSTYGRNNRPCFTPDMSTLSGILQLYDTTTVKNLHFPFFDNSINSSSKNLLNGYKISFAAVCNISIFIVFHIFCSLMKVVCKLDESLTTFPIAVSICVNNSCFSSGLRD